VFSILFDELKCKQLHHWSTGAALKQAISLLAASMTLIVTSTLPAAKEDIMAGMEGIVNSLGGPETEMKIVN